MRKRPLSGSSLGTYHRALLRDGGVSQAFRVRWILRETEAWLPQANRQGGEPEVVLDDVEGP